jgi:hypothetical protein
MLRVALEVAPKRAFASAIDWPGWARAGRTPDEALEALVRAGARYAPVVERAGMPFAPAGRVSDLELVERLEGGSGTEFGVPGAIAAAEEEAVPPDELDRLRSLLEAAWATFDDAASAAAGRALRLGPRGGGRQVPNIVDHVREAEAAYVRQLGARVRSDASMAALRAAFLDAFRRRAAGQSLPEPSRARSPWPPRYAVRRSAWHALDHAWEIEDRRED